MAQDQITTTPSPPDTGLNDTPGGESRNYHMKIIKTDEGQGDNERAEAMAHKIKARINGLGIPLAQVRSGVDAAIAAKRKRQAVADGKRALALRERARAANATSWSNYCSAVIDGTVILPRLPDDYKPRRRR